MKNTFYVASVSGGKDSLAMLLLLLEMPRSIYPLTHVVYYNTGMDFDCIAHIIARVKRLCEEHGIQFVELHPEESFMYCFADKKVENRDGSGCHYGYSWCGGKCRWATRHKISAISHLKQSLGGDVVDYVGIAYDEQSRLEKEKSPNKRFPLVEWGMTEAMCLEYCRSRGWQWLEETERTSSGYIDLYDILKRVSCWCCSNKNLSELRNIYWYLPHYWSRLKILQEHTWRPFHGYYKGQPVGIFELDARFKKEFETMNEIIKNAAQVRAETKKNPEFETACARVMADIEKAKAEGKYHTLFCPRPYTLALDLKAAFLKAGYDFQPVGMVAGVYQTDEYICW